MDRQNLMLGAFVLVFLIFLAYLLLSSQSQTLPTVNSSGSQPPATPAVAGATSACTDGATASCITEKGCQGYRVCANGAFSGCLTAKQVCRPGSRTWCTENGCSQGYRYCNDCGSGYGPCVFANTSGWITQANITSNFTPE